jgi:hypothetical protein
MGVFDVITEPNARTVAERTEFSVSSASKASESIFGSSKGEERRQMARALLFVDDLSILYDDNALPRKLTDREFEGLWRGDFTVLASTLTSKVKSLCETDLHVREIMSIPASAPKPAPPRLVISEDMRTLLTKTVGNQQLRAVEISAHHSSLQTQKTAWSDAKSGLVGVFAAVVNSSTSNMIAVQNAGESAYTEFEGFFREVGKENEAKIAMAKSFFDALSSHAPFSLSIVGKIGSAAIGMAHADTAIRQERELGPPKYFDSNIPTLEKFNAKLGAVKNWTTDLTRLGVDGGTMPSGTSIRTAIDPKLGETDDAYWLALPNASIAAHRRRTTVFVRR